MSQNKLTPVSDAMRSVLSLLGETPESHQREKAKALPKPSAPAKPKLMPFKEKELTPAEIVAKRWDSHSWRPVARVMFIRETHCRGCGRVSRSPHWPETFIKEHLVRDHRSYRYLPARSSITASLQLPKQQELYRVDAHSCHLCPDWQTRQPEKEQPLCLEDWLLSTLADTASSPLKVVLTSPASLEAGSSSVTASASPRVSHSMVLDWSPTSWESYANLAESAGESTSPAHGYVFASFESGPFASAMPIPFPTTAEWVSALAIPEIMTTVSPEK